MDLESETPARRRRGAELEDALLQATWEELAEVGYGALTIDAVAQRAGTSRTVVYRRWATKRELAEATVVFISDRNRIEPPDTGSLREDLLALLRDTNDKRVGLMGLFVVYLGGYYQETGTTPYQLRRLVLDDGPTSLDLIFDRAVERGEVERDRLTPRVTSVVSDLFRHEAMMRLGPVPDDVLVSIVDEVFLPLATGPMSSGR
ncbi:TetR family transcriptional regulator [Nocardioides sp. Root1257]|uniref:TetR/AcrR family transcriptional regulator n=1 Tax=unclassified Nocardioides TaxID=2615069 RepID=UPI0006FD07D8|nr:MULTISPECIES: TetR/AcrR family transcriptional regulator [unclassified Nocardioides]KQW53062.1 TetR family transcriptional regulator [Nocardioides sp. Root1257]KRC55750.1 TetR family transcriptional regulator [Nocardioides sp. Root224]